ncbi:hypothetical protein SCLARK_00467 [Spiroplasma clarkii]|uniref:hypothetical protein n=1 Tax=Spiroplasma clarkii TaxID=2139 RepID=UPI000B556CC1|nr:hypothetical protein [Spiroplasma clarkii]ARU91181.1 hypothetical protein SCLARK_00467 [Spiroplasma clarkii]
MSLKRTERLKELHSQIDKENQVFNKTIADVSITNQILEKLNLLILMVLYKKRSPHF